MRVAGFFWETPVTAAQKKCSSRLKRSSALNQINDQDDDRNDEQQMD
jgi:hypothetical protein